MKTTTLFLILFLTGLDLWAQTEPTVRQMPRRFRAGTNAPAALPALPGFSAPTATSLIQPSVSSLDINTPAASGSTEEMIPAGNINFQGVDVNQVLDVYAQLVGRTLLRAGLPAASIVLKTETPLTKSEAIQALQAVLALNGISVVNVGDKFVKVLPVDQANAAGAEFNDTDATNLPALGSYVTHIVQLKFTKPSEMIPIIQPFAKLANSILAIDSNGILVLRDNAENVKRMLEMIDKVDVSGGNSEIVSEVIPIRYALAEDIANALNSLGGSGSTVSIGSSPAATSTINGVRPGGATGGQGGQGGINGYQGGGGGGNNNRAGAFGGAATPNGTPGTGTTFQQRLQSIIQRASSGQQDQIQVFGQTKIIADDRSNSLLIFATQADLDRIKAVVAKLDVLLAQVLIESVIMDVNYGHSWNFGVSAVQNPQTFSPSVPVIGGGGINNGQPFVDFLQRITSSITNPPTLIGTNLVQTIVNTVFSRGAGSGTNGGAFASAIPSGFSYFANIGPSWDVALQAAASDSTATVIQRPRIQTSQAKAASFFVGSTVPYVTSTYSGGTVGGNSSSYSQLSVGVELDITPFINPDGLVVMDINQEIDEISGSIPIEGVGNVPTTTKRTLSSEIAVKDKDTIILGGFVRSEKDKSKTGIPLLQDIPILGALFSSRTSNKNRDELIVLMRPTVLRTPDIAAAQAIKEEQRLPGIAHAEADDDAEAQKMIDAERKAEQDAAKSKKHSAGVFTTERGQIIDTNGVGQFPQGTNSVPQNINGGAQPNPAAGLY
jgi:general secretion pathway protein D